VSRKLAKFDYKLHFAIDSLQTRNCEHNCLRTRRQLHPIGPQNFNNFVCRPNPYVWEKVDFNTEYEIVRDSKDANREEQTFFAFLRAYSHNKIIIV
jgi:hypothetical protein